MKICFPFIGDTLGGSHISTILLMRELAKRNHELTVVLHKRGPLSTELDKLKVRYTIWDINLNNIILKPLNIVKIIIPFALLVIKTLRCKFDLVHTNDARCHILWTFITSLTRTPLVWHQRTELSQSRLTNTLIRRANAIICISNFTANSIDRFDNAALRIIPNPVTEIQIPSILRTQKRKAILRTSTLDKDSLIIGFFGNLRKVKEPLLFVRSLIELETLIDQSIIGAIFGEDRENYKTRILSETRESKFLGKILFSKFRRPIEPWMAACDLVVTTSSADAFGRVIIEAMSVGTAIVATDTGGHSEIIQSGQNGILVPFGNPKCIAYSIKSLLDSEQQIQQIINRAKSDIEQYYRPTRHADLVESVYLSVMNSR